MPNKPKTHKPAKCQVGRDPNYEDRRKMIPHLNKVKMFRSSGQWKKFSAIMRKRNPICCDPFNVHEVGQFTDDIHHVISLYSNFERRLDRENCVPLCRECHNKVTYIERHNVNKSIKIFENVKRCK